MVQQILEKAEELVRHDEVPAEPAESEVGCGTVAAAVEKVDGLSADLSNKPSRNEEIPSQIPSPTWQWDFFLAHNRCRWVGADQIASHLQRVGQSLWYDERTAFDPCAIEVEDGVRNSAVVLLFLTGEATVKSELSRAVSAVSTVPAAAGSYLSVSPADDG